MKKIKYALLLLTISHSQINLANTSDNWTLQKQLHLPEWLTLKVDHRTRYEGYTQPFKKNASAGDDIFSFRTNVFMGINYQNFTLGTEFIDSHIALDDSNTTISTSLVNQTDLLQAYLAWHSDNLLDSGLDFDIKLGRQTMNVGSRRLIARNRYRNTINNFTGFDMNIGKDNSWQWRNFVVLPVSRLPNSKTAMRAGKTQFDQEDFQRLFAGTFFSLKHLPFSTTGELYLYYLNEDNTAATKTTRRKLFTPGFRLFKKAKVGEFDYEFESVFQVGTSYISKTSTKKLDHFAYFDHISVGYTFKAPWQPQLIFQYDYASGDKNPNDGQNNRFQTLYGARRFEFGPTSIWGAFARGNLSTPGIRLKLKPTKTVNFFIAHRAYWLAQSTDMWTGTKIQDKTGNSGSYLGQQLELRLRWKAIPKQLDFEAGWAHFFKGSFAKNAPGTPTNKNDSDYLYVQTGIHF